MKHLDVMAVLVAETNRASGQHRLQAARIVVEGRRLMLRIVLILALVHEKRDRFGRNRLKKSLDGVDKSGLPARNHHEPIVKNEQARLRKEITIAMLVAKHRQDLGPGSRDDAPPHVVAQRTERREVRCHDQLQLLFGSFEEVRRRHQRAHDAQMRAECKHERRILA